MAIEIILEDAVSKMQATVNAIIEVRRRFGKHDQGFLDVYPTAMNERAPLTTCEFLMCLLLPIDALSESVRYRQQFSLDGLLPSEELKQLVLDDMKYVITQLTRKRGENAPEPARPDFDCKEPYLDGKPYAYLEKGVGKIVVFSPSIDAASFYLSCFVLLKRHLKGMLATRWEGYSLAEWVDRIIDHCLEFLEARIHDGWAFFDSKVDQEPDERSIFFFTWTATEALVTAAALDVPAAQELVDTVLKPKTLPRVEERIKALPKTGPEDLDDDEERLAHLYVMTHLGIISSLLESSASDDIAAMIARSFDYWAQMRHKLFVDVDGELTNNYYFGDYRIVDIGIYPLYLRSLFLALRNPNVSASLVGQLEQELTSAYNDLLNMYPRPPVGDRAQKPLEGFDQWTYLGSNAKGGLHFIFLTERVIEAYASVILNLLPQQTVEEELALRMTLTDESLRALLAALETRLRAAIDERIDRRLDRIRKQLSQERSQQKPHQKRVKFVPSEEQKEELAELIELTKVLVDPRTPELLAPSKKPPVAEVKKIRKEIEELEGATPATSLEIDKAISRLTAFRDKWDDDTVKSAMSSKKAADKETE